MSIVIAIVIILVIIFLFVYFVSKIKKRKRKTRPNETDLVGYENDNLTSVVVENLKREVRTEPNLENTYRLARLNQYNLANQVEADHNYAAALHFAINGEFDVAMEGFFTIIHDVAAIGREINTYVDTHAATDTVVKTRKEKIKEATANNEERAELYFNDVPVFNDTQNVHESELNKQLKRKFDTIKSKNTDTYKDLLDLQQKIATYPDPEVARKALQTYNHVTNASNFITHLNVNENEVLQQVWNRVNSEDNAESTENLTCALVEGMAGCLEKNTMGTEYMVCSMGRCSRIIDSLTLMDNDDAIKAPLKTKDLIRKEVFTKAHKLLENRLASDEGFRNLYNATDLSDTQNQELKAHIDTVKTQLKESVDKDYMELDATVKTDILTEAQAGFTV